MGVSKSGSIKGYSFKVWLVRNKENIKMLITTAVGIAAFFSTQYLPVALQAGCSALLAVGAKLGLDAVDFFLSEVELKE